jgi:hypothetical protein
MKPRDYCCCAIPTINTGIYTTLTEQLVLGIVVGTLSVATPRIVGAATPAVAPWILGIVCYVAAALQILGFIGVSKERAILYRRYVTLHLLTMMTAFGVAALWIILSATRHGAAVTRCLQDFFTTSDSTFGNEGATLCDIFAWVDIGLMSGLWVFLAAVQLYFYVIVSSYGTSQQQAHDDYAAIPLKSRYNARPSGDLNNAVSDYQHVRAGSDMSVTGPHQAYYQEEKPSHHTNMSDAQRPFEPYHEGDSVEGKSSQHHNTIDTHPSFEPHRGYTQDKKPSQDYISPLRQPLYHPPDYPT